MPVQHFITAENDPYALSVDDSSGLPVNDPDDPSVDDLDDTSVDSLSVDDPSVDDLSVDDLSVHDLSFLRAVFIVEPFRVAQQIPFHISFPQAYTKRNNRHPDFSFSPRQGNGMPKPTRKKLTTMKCDTLSIPDIRPQPAINRVLTQSQTR